MIHVFAFAYYGLCPVNGHVSFLQGQWQEIEPQLEKLDCEVCKLVVLIMRANKFEKLFNSNQIELARTLKKLMEGT